MSPLTRTRMGLYVLDDDIALSRYVNYHGTLEVPDALKDVSFVAPMIPEGGVVIDAGACLGDHTGLYSQIVGVSGHVYAFEPHPVTYEALRKNMARLNNVTCIQAGLSDRPGHATLQMTPNVGASFFHGVTTDEWPQADIIVKTLDQDLTPFLARCDFIHLDAEGMEPKILAGARQLIQRFRPVLMLEVSDDWLQRYGYTSRDLFAMLEAWDYQVQRVQTSHTQFDVVCVPRVRTVDGTRQGISVQVGA